MLVYVCLMFGSPLCMRPLTVMSAQSDQPADGPSVFLSALFIYEYPCVSCRSPRNVAPLTSCLVYVMATTMAVTGSLVYERLHQRAMIDQSREQQVAALHDCTRRISHPDSEDAVRAEQQRIAQELTPYKPKASTQLVSRTYNPDDEVLSTIRPSSCRGSVTVNVPLQSRESLESYATTLPDVPYSVDNSIHEKHWFNPLVNFWTTHVR
jgi:hypothetical protein